ncbi:MAG: hybrid sensor histidine kinase/response regulator [Anaerolineae bacterium]|nr:hybrid sensor histidine kinase/response regulator [Anaerolineae bacterium]
MLQTIRAYLAADTESIANREDLRRQLTSRLALLLTLGSGTAMWLTLPYNPFPITLFELLCILFLLGIGARAIVLRYPALARQLLIWGSAFTLFESMRVFSASWLPFLSLILIPASVLLAPGSGLATVGMIAGAAAWWTHIGVRSYPLWGLLAGQALGLAVGWLGAHTLYMALQWAWNMQQRADRLLEISRDHQAELSRALRSLELANEIQRRTQHELAVARRQAEEARRMKEQFAANISHELRTPLNLILGFSELMYLSPEIYGDMQWPPTLRRDVYQIYRSSRHLLEMIDDILDLSRFEIVGFTLNKEPTPLEPLLRGAVEIARDLFRGRPVRLEVDIEPDLPILEIDRTRIRQVLLNLLTNAQRFTEEGVVRVEAKRVDGEVVVSVSDTGPGIPADKLPYIFDEFYQVDHSLRRSHSGAGLGLAICKHFVQAHDGRIWVKSQEGVGSTFSFSLPITGQYLPASHLHVERPIELPWSESRPRVLVLDPDPAVAAIVRRHIDGFDIIQLPDAGQLEEAIALHHPHMVICNVSPNTPSVQHCETRAPVPVIECSLPSHAWFSRELAVAASLSKPVTQQQLLETIERLGGARDVLIVDDDRGFCQLITRMLETADNGFHVRHAYDGTEGIQAMRASRPDLVFLDLAMPGADGFEFLEEMRQDAQLAGIPVVLLTAVDYARDPSRQMGTRLLVHRADGLRPTEVLRCLKAISDVLKPRYDERSVPKEVGGAVA